MKRATTAIITTAGYGTRRLPVTKSLEKSMLPLGNRPVIDYLVEDCARAGIKDIYFVVSGPATQLRSYYERNVELEEYLDSVGKPELAKAIMPPDGVRFHYIEQDLSDGRYGTTIPVWLVRDYIPKDELVVVAYGDAAIRDSDGSSSLRTMIEAGEPSLLAVKVADDVDLSKTGGVIDGIKQRLVRCIGRIYKMPRLVLTWTLPLYSIRPITTLKAKNIIYRWKKSPFRNDPS